MSRPPSALDSGNLHFDVVGAEGPKRYFGALSRASLGHAYLLQRAGRRGKEDVRAASRAVAALPGPQRRRARIRRHLFFVRPIRRRGERSSSRLSRAYRTVENRRRRRGGGILRNRGDEFARHRATAFDAIVRRRHARAAPRRREFCEQRSSQRAAEVLGGAAARRAAAADDPRAGTPHRDDSVAPARAALRVAFEGRRSARVARARRGRRPSRTRRVARRRQRHPRAGDARGRGRIIARAGGTLVLR